jgi:periplasmic protein TonB
MNFRVWMGSVTVLCLIASCDSEPPPPPPPGPSTNWETDIDDKLYEGEESVEIVPYPEESVEPYLPSPERRALLESEQVVEEVPPNVVDLTDEVVSIESDMVETEEPSLNSMNVGSDGLEFPVRFAQEMPVYPGGEPAFARDLNNQIKYPEQEKENGISGTVFVEFIVEKDGSISNVEVVRGVNGGPGLSKEALRALKNVKKKFSPAKQNGIPVRCQMTWPIKFVLQ